MATEIKFRRGTTAQHATFTGASGEVTVDTDKKTLVVHDGVTPGGQPLPTTTTNIPSDNSVSTIKIQDNAVTNAKMADNSVNTAEIVNGALSANTTGRAKMADGFLTLPKLDPAAYASQAEAEAGTENTKLLTPLRGWQQGVKRNSRFLHVRDQKATGTAGGSSVVGIQVRTLNTVVRNDITGASLSSNQVTLPAGVYDVFASAPSFRANFVQLGLRETTGGTYLLDGPHIYSSSVADYASVMTMLEGRITLASTTTVELVMYASVAQTTVGLGSANAGSPFPAVFSQLFIQKVD